MFWQLFGTFHIFWGNFLQLLPSFCTFSGIFHNCWQLLPSFGKSCHLFACNRNFSQLLANFGIVWLLFASFGNFWHVLAAFDDFWQIWPFLAIVGNFKRLWADFGKFWLLYFYELFVTLVTFWTLLSIFANVN